MAQARTTGKRGVSAGAPSPVLAGLVAALQHVSIGMAVVGADGQVIAINRAFGRMLGHERDDALPDEVMAIVDPAERVGDGAPWPRLVAGDIASYERQRRFAHRDGTVRWGGVTISALRDDAGELIGALAQIQDITAQKAAEATVRENEARLMALVEQLPVALYRQEPGAAGAFHYVSPLFERLSGLRQDVLPTSFAELLERVHPEDRAAVQAADDRAGRTGEPAQVQYRLRGGDGDWLWVENRAVPMRDDDGRPLAWHGALLDITARVRLEASLRESELRFRRAFEDAAIGMSLGSPDLICLDANAAYCRIVGRPREELIGLSFETLTHPDDLAAYHQQIARLRAGETDAFEIEQRYPRPDGSTVICRLTVSAVRDETGEILYDFGQLQDITPYKAASAALREQQARLRKLVEHLPAALYRQDAPADGSATYVNPSFAVLLALEPDELPLGFPAYFGRVHPDDREAVQRGAAHAERTGEPMDLEYRLQRGDGEWTWVHDRSVLERDEEGRARSWTGILLDISDRKEAALALEAALETQRTAIAELEWLNQSKSRFLSTISHEFRTPLTAIIGYSEFLVANADDPVAVAEDAVVIHREASRLNRMVDDVLLLDRADAGRLPLQREPLHINALVEDVADTFRPLTESHQLVLSLAPDLRAVAGDRDRLLQAITNLVSNAVKYSPGGGEITITTHNHGDDVLLTVQDQGLGIAPADLPRVFDRFERVESGNAGRIWGTGLGLSIVREIAALHGGRVWAESEPGMGSTFFLALPGVAGDG